MPGWKAAHSLSYFPFTTLQKMLILVSLLTDIGAHQHDEFTPQILSEFGQNPQNQTTQIVWVTHPFSFSFSFP